MSTFNIYCDESCHLIKDKNNIMLLGAIWCPEEKKKEISKKIIAIKNKYNLPQNREMKWVKFSQSKFDCYKELINYFFEEPDLHFRVVVIDNKQNFDNKNCSWDEFYYKTYFYLLRNILQPESFFNIYIDKKDTQCKYKIFKLRDVLCNSVYDFSHNIIKNIQTVNSKEIQIMQITDILMGAIGYYLRGLNKVDGKNELVSLIQKRSSYSFTKTTLPQESKFNIFHFPLERKV